MFKKFILFFILIISFSNIFTINNVFSAEDYDLKVESSSTSNWKNNEHLDSLYSSFFFDTTVEWAEGIKNTIIIIAKEVKNIFFAIAWIYFLIITIRLLFSSNSEEWFESYKKWLIWITIWIVVMQMSYAFVVNTFDQSASSLAWSLINNLFIPVINLLETLAAIFFLLIAIYSFIRLVSTNWDKEKAKKWIDSIIYATAWLFLVILAAKILKAIYWTYNYSTYWSAYVTKISNLSSFSNIIITFINWLTWFVAIVTVIMIMYAWANIIFSWWDDEKVKKWRTTILYAFIWIFILVISYLIITFFIWPEWNKIVPTL